MAIPVYLQQFKAAGIYRVVFDKSTIENEDTTVLRLVVGYSEKGPFNIPVYVKDPQTFTTLFGGISKKLEKRGVYFHRLALQMLNTHPIICLNLKKFDGETLMGSTICTDFNPTFDPIDTVSLKVEDIYDTTRFWELNAEQLNGLFATDGTEMDQYINLSVTDTKANSVSYFIRKASGSKVSQYNISVNDWYSDGKDERPEFLENQGNNRISDYFAEIYVFKGKFTARQVLASDTLKNYFIISDKLDENGEYQVKLRNYVVNAFGEPVDTLDLLYKDSTSNPIGHWVGSLIPYFKDKQGNYQALDILFNTDIDEHKMMMSFNVDLLEEDNAANIDLSGRLSIPTETAKSGHGVIGNKYTYGFDLNNIFEGNARTKLLGNYDAPVVSDIMHFTTNAYNTYKYDDLAITKIHGGYTKISGALYVSSFDDTSITLTQVGAREEDETTGSTIVDTTSSSDSSDSSTSSTSSDDDTHNTVTIMCSTKEQVQDFLVNRLGVQFELDENGDIDFSKPKQGFGTYWNVETVSEDSDSSAQPEYAFENPMNPLAGPEKIITTISRIVRMPNSDKDYTDKEVDLKVSFRNVYTLTKTYSKGTNLTSAESVYGSSVTFIDRGSWEWDEILLNGIPTWALFTSNQYDKSLLSVLHPGDCILANDGTPKDTNGDQKIDSTEENVDPDDYYDNVYVNDSGSNPDGIPLATREGVKAYHYIILSGEPATFVYNANADGDQSTDLGSSQFESWENQGYIVRIDAPLNQEIGEMIPVYLEGYTYKNIRPNGTDMWSKVLWQNEILSALTDYKGLRVGLLNKAEIDYRYVIDTFESYPVSSLKSVLSFLCKEKQSAFCISNFPAVKTFVKCPYTSFTDANGVFNAEYIANGYNRKKAASIRFSLPDDVEGASFIAFYSPLKFSDGYVDMTIPSAGLVSNLFMQKYMSRQPYYIVAGPNYGNIKAPGLVGPDYKYSIDELNVLEPLGVNCMVYRPTFGTFINANQTAKQTPVSALSKVNVRELVIYLQDEIEKVLQAYQWEFNNATTRNAILDRANQICALVAANGGIQAYQNIMDESNNTPEIIDNEMAILSTAIEPGMGCGKMIQELTLYRTGRLSSSIIE